MKVVPVTTIAKLVREKQMMLLPAPKRLEVAMTDFKPQIGLLIVFGLCQAVTGDSAYTLRKLSLPAPEHVHCLGTFVTCYPNHHRSS